MQVRELKMAALLLASFFLVGAAAGAGYALLNASGVAAQKYNTAQLTQNLQFAEVEAGRLQCVVLLDKAELYNKPSGLEGNVIEYMSKGVQVDYLDTVSSMDKDERYAVTTVEMQFQRLWGARHIIPLGTQVMILRADDDSGEIKGRVLVDGKYYDKVFDTQYLRFPYVGQWKKVEFQGKPGFMKYETLSESKLM
ncbi:hypothetical protein [uncultured Phascolarctobacterium sp.]|uniref:hypothetical protein n=1 Tax=uncultured Phascolarctobacterium sp. TaxID=512296 RepID=UPI002607CCB7|nr:hypothetical protein [uncultured Phascolarctobacterium sp.]